MIICTYNNILPKFPYSNTDLLMNNDNKIYGHSWNEISMIELLMRSKTLIPDFVELVSYRRKLNISENEINLLKENNYIGLGITKFNKSIYEQYKLYHNIEDLYKIIEIIKNNHNDIDYNIVYNTNFCYTNSLIYCNKLDFIKASEFVISVLYKFSELTNTHTDELTEQYVLNNKNKYNFFSVNYQSRLHGFLAERIYTLYWLSNCKDRIKEYDIITY